MNSWIKNLIGLAAGITIIIIVLVVGSIVMLHNSLPEYSGEIESEQLSSNVDIYRDSYGVSYIDAKEEIGAYFALGYVHAQERLFQMDLSRRAGEGRLSEIFGSETLFFDKMFKTIGLGKIASENFLKYDDHIKQILIAYSNGVNDFINNSPEKYTIEFDILGYEPYLWKPEHSLLIAKLMAWELNISWWSDIAFSHLIQKLGKEKVLEILPNFDENGPTIIPNSLEKLSQVPTELMNIDKQYRKFIGAVGTHIGSNNWVVSGEKSTSGKPIIANDPHLGFAAPGKWYVTSLNMPERQINGFTLPGIPGIVIGNNRKISWVLTNIMADDADFYIEKLDTSKTKYLFDDEWRLLEIYEDTIKVKDSSEVIIEIKKTHRGPIISDVHTYNKIFTNDYQSKATMSMRWSALEFSNEMLAFYKINNSNNWQEFRDGLEYFHSPGQNFVYADDEGNIGYTAGVKLPKRKFNSPTFVYDGTTSEYDWHGYLPFQENPTLFNPGQGYIASANNKTIMDYPYHISNIWEPPSRIKRITELLQSKNQHSIEDFKVYQNDFYSHYAKDLVPYTLKAFENYKINDQNIKTALSILRQWDFIMHLESQVPCIYAVFYQKLIENIFKDELGEELFNEYIFLANVPYRVIPKLLADNNSVWFDNIETDDIESRDQIIRTSFIAAIEFLENTLGNNIAAWQWGKIHKVTFKHFFHGASSLLDKLFDIGPFEIGGDGTTIFNTEYSFTSPYENKLGPSMRYIYDFSQPDIIEFILPTGQSGHFFSDHYNDMTEMWLSGEYIKLNTNIDSIRSNNFEQFKLLPHR